MSGAEMQVREVEGWALGFAENDIEPRIRDEELGRRLGFKSPRDVRKIIERMVDAQKLSAVRVCATASQTSGGRPGREFWLTEAQALKVAAKSETEPADAILDEMIHVFMLARRGQLPPAPAPLAPPPQMPEATWELLTTALLKIDALTQTVMPADRYPRVKVCLAQMRSDLEAELARREPEQPPPAPSAQTALAFPR
jgi:hypothetical protein